ncbi:MAG: hypothetical protein MPJ24_08915 [Pirellulaceae bacterium]|nr:hypothetical protein [Pirellulaceae bacterium]
MLLKNSLILTCVGIGSLATVLFAIVVPNHFAPFFGKNVPLSTNSPANPSASSSTPPATSSYSDTIQDRTQTEPLQVSPFPSHKQSPFVENHLVNRHLPQKEDYQQPVSNQFQSLAQKLDQLEQSSLLQQENISNIAKLLLESEEPKHSSESQNTPSSLTDKGGGEGTKSVQLPLSAIEQVSRDGFNITIKESEIRDVFELLSEESGLSIMATSSVTGTTSAILHNTTAKKAFDAIVQSTGFVSTEQDGVLYVGTVEEIGAMVKAHAKVATRIYRPNHIEVAELKTLLEPLITEGIGQIISSTEAETTVGEGALGERNTNGSRDVLLVRDYETVLLKLDSYVVDLDIPPLQVQIEAMILSVNLSDKNELGVDFEVLRNESNARLLSGSPLTTLGGINVSDGGLKIGFLDSSVSALITALETVGDTNVVASPRLTCLNRAEADILIGDEIGYISTTVTETAATQTVEFLEVGTQLTIKPFIASDGTIRMSVQPELSSGDVQVIQNFTIPRKNVTKVTTDILCNDGATVVIGGLIREQLADSTSQIPLLGSWPLVGPAFRQKKETTDRHEIIILITPRIVQNDLANHEGHEIGGAFMQRQATYAEKMSLIGKRHYGRRYQRLAQTAWSAGDAQSALRYVNLALHFDQLNLETIRLRNEIIQNSDEGNQTIRSQYRSGLRPLEMPRNDYSQQGYGWDSPDPPGTTGRYRATEYQPTTGNLQWIETTGDHFDESYLNPNSNLPDSYLQNPANRPGQVQFETESVGKNLLPVIGEQNETIHVLPIEPSLPESDREAEHGKQTSYRLPTQYDLSTGN